MTGDNRGWRARVEADFALRGVRIDLARHTDGAAAVYEFPRPEVRVIAPDEEHAARPLDAGLVLEDDAARALYEALAEHYGHSGHDTRTLRRDFEHERARHDLAVDALTRIAEGIERP